MATIGSLSVSLVARTEKFSRGMKSARGDVKLFGSALTRAKGLLVGFGAAMAAGFSVRSLTSAADQMDRIADRAQNLHVGVDAFTRFGHVAKLSGSDIEGVGKAINKMNRVIGNGGVGLSRLGLDAEKISRLSTDQQFLTIGGAIAKMESPAEKTAVAMQLFGKSGAELVPMFERGSNGIKRLMDESDRLGITISQVAAADVGAMIDGIDRATAAWERMKRVIVHEVSPTIQAAAEGLEGAAIMVDNRQEKSGKPADWITRMNTPFGGRQGEDRGLFTKMFDKAFAPFMPKETTGASQERLAQLAAGGKDSDKAETIFGNFNSRGAALENLEGRGVSAAAKGLTDALSTFGEKFNQGAKALGNGMTKLEAANSPMNHLQALGNAILNPNNSFGPAAQQFGPQAKIQGRDLAPLFPMRHVETRGNAALEKGTAAAFSQERRSAQQNQLVEETKRQTKVLEKMAKKLNELKGKDLGGQLLPANVA